MMKLYKKALYSFAALILLGSTTTRVAQADSNFSLPGIKIIIVKPIPVYQHHHSHHYKQTSPRYVIVNQHEYQKHNHHHTKRNKHHNHKNSKWSGHDDRRKHR
ncbi:hypothetical protein [Kiloniella laminariae]|uniref:hypothetical protein n=1 Tax=Kiloniella laminariae TaxID=454162 RepID=UPI00036E25A2|nr:hypothetical protein [Kiloniella laminariae]